MQPVNLHDLSHFGISSFPALNACSDELTNTFVKKNVRDCREREGVVDVVAKMLMKYSLLQNRLDYYP